MLAYMSLDVSRKRGRASRFGGVLDIVRTLPFVRSYQNTWSIYHEHHTENHLSLSVSFLECTPCDIHHVTIIFRSKARKQGFRSYLPFL
jgi:hypothetical protein